MEEKLTPKQELFVSEYLKTGNAFEAARASSVDLNDSGDAYYVYFLIDPEDGEIFYVGKGIRDRLHAHFREHKGLWLRNEHKHKRLQEILDRGSYPVAKVFEDSLSESDALLLEGELIREFRNRGLTNVTNGTMPPGNAIINSCRQLLAHTEDKNVFLANLNDYGRRVTTSVCGSPEKFYDYFVFSIKHLIRMVKDEQKQSHQERRSNAE